jgi:hypothetical protein
MAPDDLLGVCTVEELADKRLQEIPIAHGKLSVTARAEEAYRRLAHCNYRRTRCRQTDTRCTRDNQ